MKVRLIAVLLVLALSGLSGCDDGGPPPAPLVFKPLDYSYLPPIMLKVSSVNVVDQYVPDANAGTLIGQAPEAPAQALSDMLNRRLVANGTPGTATATIEAASIEEVGGLYVGTMTVRVDVQGANGLSTGYTEASVTHSQTAPDANAGANDVQSALYGLTKALMDAMNVQLQYQIQQNLGSWVSYAANAAVAPLGAAGGGFGGGIQATPLTAPGAAPVAATPAPDLGAPSPGGPSPPPGGFGTPGVLGTLPVTPPVQTAPAAPPAAPPPLPPATEIPPGYPSTIPP